MKHFTPIELYRCLRAMAILDIALQPKEKSWLRLVNYKPLHEGVQFTVNNGGGDHLTVFLTKSGVFIKGFDHENELNLFAAEEWDISSLARMYAGAPSAFLALLGDGEEREEVTFCMWCSNDSEEWTQNETEGNDGGKEYMLGFLCQSAAQWCDWAKAYYKISPDAGVVNSIYDQEPVTPQMITALNPNRDTAAALQELALFPMGRGYADENIDL